MGEGVEGSDGGGCWRDIIMRRAEIRKGGGRKDERDVLGCRAEAEAAAAAVAAAAAESGRRKSKKRSPGAAQPRDPAAERARFEAQKLVLVQGAVRDT